MGSVMKIHKWNKIKGEVIKSQERKDAINASVQQSLHVDTMKTYTEEEAVAEIIAGIDSTDSCETDNTGQLIVYTGIFVWGDGTLHDQAEPVAATDS